MNAPQAQRAQVKDPVRPCAEIGSQSRGVKSEESSCRDLEVQGIEDEGGVEEAEEMKLVINNDLLSN